MTTAQRTQRPMTPNEYRYWWDRASDEDIRGYGHKPQGDIWIFEGLLRLRLLRGSLFD